MKTVLFVPGFQEDLTSRNYDATIRALEKAGYTVEFVAINWMRTTIDDWVRELNDTYASYDPTKTILAGFSFGAMTVFMASVSRSPAELWLFSLSPYFLEDQKSRGFKQSWLKQIGHRRRDTFKKLQFSKLVKEITSKMIFFYGKDELKKWSDITYRDDVVATLPHASLRLIDNVGHDVTNKLYVDAIIEEVAA